MTTETIAPQQVLEDPEVIKVSSAAELIELAHELGRTFSSRATDYDQAGEFVEDNYADLKRHHLMSMMIPRELGGMGFSHSVVGDFLRILAHYCGSTSLAFAMHQHLVAASVWKYIHQAQGADLLRRVAAEQLVLISTGARDWLDSNGELKRVEGGYLLTATKHFASQSVYGDIAVTSAPFQSENGDWSVLHFGVPMNRPGVSVLNDWDVMGMRATGSQSIRFENVFVPEESVALSRTRGEFHPVWNLVLTVAMPLISSTYTGLAERAFSLALDKGRNYQRNLPHIKYIIGKIHNSLAASQAQLEAMFRVTNDLDFDIARDNSTRILSLKTNVADNCMETVKTGMEAIGGQSFYRMNELERIFRDVQAAQFHPLPKWEQYFFTGERLLQQA